LRTGGHDRPVEHGWETTALVEILWQKIAPFTNV
jgi:hypothetical protein